MRRIHLLDEETTLGGAGGTKRRAVKKTMCGLYEPLDAPYITEDPGAVGCLNCIDRVEKADAGITRESVRGRARQHAFPRAYRRLIEAHHDEFDRLLAEEFELAVPVVMERERSYQEYLARHGD